MQQAIDITGRRFHRLLVLHRAAGSAREARWLCACDCGVSKVLTGSVLRNGATRSCGCLNMEKRRARATHGMSATPTYRNWATMIQRCTNSNVSNYADYGGRGIHVCRRWLTFENFVRDMGPAPPGLLLERRDNNKGYDKDNCYWATRAEQSRNKRNNRLLAVGTLVMPLIDWARACGIAHATLRERLDRGWSVEDACTRPPRPLLRRGKKIDISSMEG